MGENHFEDESFLKKGTQPPGCVPFFFLRHFLTVFV